MTAPLTTLEDIQAAAARIGGVVRRTPLLDVEGHPSGISFRIKCENLQRTGSFKLRGAYNTLAQLPPESRVRGVIGYSSGNHAQAVACAARALTIPAIIVMPENASPVKVEGTRRYGAEVIFAGTTSHDRQVRAEAEAAGRGLTIVPPFDHARIVAGAGTVGLEILEQCAAADVQIRPTVVYVPMGGGGQIAGVSAALKQSRGDVRVVGVEPAGAARMTASRAAGKPVTLPSTSSIADGLLTLRPGDLTFAHVQAFVDDVVTVTDGEIEAAVRWLFHGAKMVAEPSGAATVAAVLKQPSIDEGTVAIVSGGNVTPELFAKILHPTP